MSDDEDLANEADSLRYFTGLQTRDEGTRRHFLDSVEKLIESWSKRSQTGENNFLNDSLLCLLKLEKECPFQDVRERCKMIFENLEQGGVRIPRRAYAGPSSFIPSKEVVWMDTDDEQTLSLLVEAFLSMGRASHVIQLMAFHPQYLDCFIRTHLYLMTGEGPLPYSWRYYIAIMGASRHQCIYLVRLAEWDFLKQGGDPDWLKNPENAPQKLRDLQEVNMYMAHRPWLIDTKHFQHLLRKGSNNWSLAEVVQALVILAHYHCLSCFCFGLGVTPEPDMEGGYTYRGKSVSTADSASYENNVSSSVNHNHVMDGDLDGVEMSDLVARMKEVQEEHEMESEITKEEMFKQFEKVESGELTTLQGTSVERPAVDLSRYIIDPRFYYEEFAKRKETAINTFRAQDYSWEEHGFSLLNRLYNDIGPLLDEKFQMTRNLTYNYIGTETDVDTFYFRMATWNYIHLVFGIYHDDYHYSEVNKLMEKPYKQYIKKVACFPEKTTQDDYLHFMRELTPSEKVHINLLLHESKMQAELLYTLRALMKWMNT